MGRYGAARKRKRRNSEEKDMGEMRQFSTQGRASPPPPQFLFPPAM